MVRVGALCAGYGGLEMALSMIEPTARVSWVAETDPDMSRVLKRAHPDASNHGDITLSPWRDAAAIDVLTAGFPCQPVSAAGRQAVKADHRWLWPDVLRCVVETRPGAAFLENVRNLVSVRYAKTGTRGEVFRDILADLRAAGYRVRWTVIGACAIGAPHHRHRVFVLAGRVPGPAPEAEHVRSPVECGAPRNGGRVLLPTPQAHEGRDGSPALNAGTAGRRYASGRRNLEDSIALLPTPTVTNAHGNHVNNRGELLLPGVVAQLLPTPTARDGDNAGRGEGNPGYWQMRRADLGRTNGVPLDAAVNAMLPTPRASDGKNGGPNQGIASGDIALSSAVIGDRWGRYAAAVALWERLTGRSAPEPTEIGPKGGRRLAAALPEWMMGLPAGYLTGEVDRLPALRGAGNGVLPAQAAMAYAILTGRVST